MKFTYQRCNYIRDESGPARDLWIEIENEKKFYTMVKSGPARDLWIEI